MANVYEGALFAKLEDVLFARLKDMYGTHATYPDHLAEDAYDEAEINQILADMVGASPMLILLILAKRIYCHDHTRYFTPTDVSY
jgi:hypothetical protein